MIITQIIDNVPTKRFSIDYGEVEYILDNGSKMRVAICKNCKVDLKDKDTKEVMECVKRGWKKELESLHNWSEDKKADYIQRYDKLSIIGKTIADVETETLEEKLKGVKI